MERVDAVARRDVPDAKVFVATAGDDESVWLAPAEGGACGVAGERRGGSVVESDIEAECVAEGFGYSSFSLSICATLLFA